MSLKEKIQAALGNETLDTSISKTPEAQKPTEQRPKLFSKPKKHNFNMEEAEAPIKTQEATILSLLNIKLKTELEDIVLPEDVRAVEFAVTAPTGFAADEVENFCIIVEKSIAKYVKALDSRDKDVYALVTEVENLEKKLIESQQNMGNFSNNLDTDELNDKVMDLTIELDELRKEKDSLQKKLARVSSPVIVSEQYEALKAENEFLKQRNVELTAKIAGTDTIKEDFSIDTELPELSNDTTTDIKIDKDEFSSILDQIDQED